MAKNFNELAQRVMTPKARARAEARTRQMLSQMLLSEIRKLAGKSQGQLARQLGIKQPSLSKLENQDDMQISTLKKIIEALGGEVRITAKLNGREMRILPFDKPSARARQSNRKAA